MPRLAMAVNAGIISDGQQHVRDQASGISIDYQTAATLRSLL
jgi:hypothetical protein